MILQYIKLLIISLLVCGACIATAFGQTTSFTYQGKLTDSSVAANGTYQMQFGLYDGTNLQIGSTITNASVQVVNGIFTVTLDFGAGAFPGASRFLQIAVFSTATNQYVPLTPKQAMTSAPYSVRSLNASTADTATNSQQLGGIAANQYVQTSDPRMSDDRDPLAGSSNYIQNGTTAQPSSNFYISGNGNANSFNALSKYYIGGNQILAAPGTNNVVAGFGAGFFNTTGVGNAFFGQDAGYRNVSGANNAYFGASAGLNSTASNNSFFGSNAGTQNSTGAANTFAGYNSGAANLSGSFNSFFGSNAGAANTTAINNSFFGQGAGFKNTLGHDNTFVGNGAGLNNIAANGNTFVGSLAGQATSGGSNNTFLGINAGVANVGSNNNTFLGANSANTNLTGSGNTYIGANTDGSFLATNATAIGQNAFAGQSNSLILGGINGLNGSVSDTNVGIGTSTPQTQLNITGHSAHSTVSTYPLLIESDSFNVGLQLHSSYDPIGGHTWSIEGNGTGSSIGQLSFTDSAFSSHPMQLTSAGPGNSSLFVDGTIALKLLTGGQQSVCFNNPGTAGILSTCSSSLRYKKDIQPFAHGLNLLNKLQPITFRWKSNDAADLGFGAEDVAKVEPLLVTHNAKGEVEGVKYDRISAVLVNAVKEQQLQIDAQQKQIDELKKLVYRNRRHTAKRK